MTLYNYAIQSWHIDEDGAWDIIYKVLFKITERINEYSFKNENQFRSMLYSIFNNELINFYHKSKRIEERLKILSFDDSLSSSLDTENIGSINREVSDTIFKSAFEEFWSNPQADNPLLNYLNDLLDELEDWERILINQRSIGVSYREIAIYTDKPEHQLKVYYGRIKNKIQTKLIEKMNNNKDE